MDTLYPPIFGQRQLHSPHFAWDLAGFVFALLTAWGRVVRSRDSTLSEIEMSKQKSRAGRPPLSESEKSVPTVIRLLPSVREVIKNEAERQERTVSDLLREIVEGRVVQLRPKRKVKAEPLRESTEMGPLSKVACK